MSAPVMAGAFALGFAINDFSEAATGRRLDGARLLSFATPSVELGVALAVACGLAVVISRPRRPALFVLLGCLTAPLWTLWGIKAAGDPAESGIRPLVAGSMGLVFGVWAAYALAGAHGDGGERETPTGLRVFPSLLLGTWGLFAGLFAALLFRYFEVWHRGGYASSAPDWNVEWKTALVVGLGFALLGNRRSDVDWTRQMLGAAGVVGAGLIGGALGGLPHGGPIAFAWMLLGATVALRAAISIPSTRETTIRETYKSALRSFRVASEGLSRALRRKVVLIPAGLLVVGAGLVLWLNEASSPHYHYPEVAARYWERNCALTSEECDCAWRLIQERIPYSDWDYFTFHQSTAQAERSKRIDAALTAVVEDCRS